MDRKGRAMGALPALILVGIVVLAISGIGIWYSVRQQTVPTQDIIEARIDAELQTSTKASQLLVRAYDRSSTAKTQVNVDSYAWKTNAPATFLKNGAGEDTSETSTLTVTGLKVNDKIDTLGFKPTGYYGDIQTVTPTDEGGLTVDMNVYAIGNSTQIRFFDEFGTTLTEDGNENLTVLANQVKKFDKIRVTLNETNAVFRVGAIGLDDTAEDSNISKIEVTGLTERVALSRLRGTLNYVFDVPTVSGLSGAYTRGDGVVLDKYIQLDGTNDFFEFGPLFVTGDANGWQLPGERVVVYVIDTQCFESAEQGKGILCSEENDAATPADVGAGDRTNDFLAAPA